MIVLHQRQWIWLATALAGPWACAGGDDTVPEADGDADADADSDADSDADGDGDLDACFGTLTSDPQFAHAMQILRAELDERLVPGGAIAIVWGGEIRHVGVAGSKGWTCDPVTPGTRFRAGVLTEPVTAATVLGAPPAETVLLDEPITDAVPEFQVIGDEHAITMRHLLTHQSGFGGDLALDECLGLADWAQRTRSDRTWATAGALYQYNPANYALVGRAVEETTRHAGFEYAAWRRVYGPLEMTATTFDPAFAVNKDHSDGHGAWGGRIALDRLNCGAERPALGLITSIKDYAKFVAMLQNEGDGVIGPEAVAAIVHGEEVSFYPSRATGFGLERTPAVGDVPEMVVRYGAGEGFSQALVMAPAYRLAVIVFMNADYGRPRLVARQVARSILGLKVTAPFEPEPAALEGLAGTYREVLDMMPSPGPTRSLPHRERTLQIEARSAYLVGVLDGTQMFIFRPVVDTDVFEADAIPAIGRMRFWRDERGIAQALSPLTTEVGPPFYRVP